ncbi:MAG TPA: hut operon positive regulator HutP [Firmicutes bacterium]|nr:hut operon positive regulator HutP [Bacillota bacterium]
MIGNSKEVAAAALRMAISCSREEERVVKEKLRDEEIRAAAVDFGGETVQTVKTIIERAVVAAKREFLVDDNHAEEGAVAGATHEALQQIFPKALGLNLGGKIGLARRGEHLSVAVFCAVGLLHLNEVAVGLGHRAVK